MEKENWMSVNIEKREVAFGSFYLNSPLLAIPLIASPSTALLF
jgi:hypothetical protein